MIDLTKSIRDCVEDDFLASLVLTDNGGTSFNLLETLLRGAPSWLISVRLRDPQTISEKQKEDIIKRIAEGFETHGPALISECNLDQQFLDYKQVRKNTDDP